MSRPQNPHAAKLVVSALFSDTDLFESVAQDLKRAYGAIDLISPWMDFDFTDYYAKEMGKPLRRRMLVFAQLIEQLELAAIKCHTNRIETQYADSGQRRVNIDPGYLLYERFVLATGKNYSHRIYIGQGIYADLTLIYQQGAYQPLPWTYPDYAAKAMGDFLMQVRRKYSDDLKSRPITERLISKE